MKRHHSNPRLAIERFQYQRRGDHVPEQVIRHSPVGEEEVLPDLAKDPGPLGRRPWPVAGFSRDPFPVDEWRWLDPATGRVHRGLPDGTLADRE